MRNDVVSREVWLQARAELLVREKEHTRARSELAEARRQLPWVAVDKQYSLVGENGETTLAGLFEEQSQLAVYHIMFGEGWEAVCSGCMQWANAMNSTTEDVKRADARLIAVSRAPYPQIAAERERRGWTFPWYSAHGSDFNIDFHASSDDLGHAARDSFGAETVEFERGENHGVNIFYRDDDGDVFHTYSAFNRGIEAFNGAFGYFDALPKGRAW
ncbi:MAG: DUF899 domain-containing protein [Pseudomonadaceae bacterium]|nr:DUF899 domain-containing protein [Pseudomonadaceae bacterium]